MPSDGNEAIDLAESFGDVARALLSESDVDATLHRIVHLAVQHLAHCESAGISYVDGRTIMSPAASGDVPLAVDRLQGEVDEGPCLDAIRHHEVFRTGDLGAETRWPHFAARAHDETGVTSVLSLRLFAGPLTFGALNLYSSARDAFDSTDVALGSVFAVHAAVAISASFTEARLEEKAASRDVIGQAKGIIMATEHVTDAEAYNILRIASHRLNTKLRAVAEQVDLTGETP